MPLYKCTKCGCLDNTACGGDYWHVGGVKAQCVECLTGKWHGAFEKKTPEEWGMVPDTSYNVDFYKSPKDIKPPPSARAD